MDSVGIVSVAGVVVAVVVELNENYFLHPLNL